MPFVPIGLLYQLQRSFAAMGNIHPLARHVFLTAMVALEINVVQNCGWAKSGNISFSLTSMDSCCLLAMHITATFALCFLTLLTSWSNGGTQHYGAVSALSPNGGADGGRPRRLTEI
jgi:hypothetical protein